MARFLDPSTLARTFRDPITWAAFVVDIIPFYAVIMLGWGAAPLVFLYWFENLVIGVITIARMIAAGIGKGSHGITSALFAVPFFTVHYGMFCLGHGIGLLALQSLQTEMPDVPISPDKAGEIVGYASTSGPGVLTFVAIIFAFNVFLFAWDYIGKSEFLDSSPSQEMLAPYGRIILLHVALFGGMFALIHFGEPMLGVLSLIILRVIWGIIISLRRRVRLDQKVDAVS